MYTHVPTFSWDQLLRCSLRSELSCHWSHDWSTHAQRSPCDGEHACATLRWGSTIYASVPTHIINSECLRLKVMETYAYHLRPKFCRSFVEVPSAPHVKFCRNYVEVLSKVCRRSRLWSLVPGPLAMAISGPISCPKLNLHNSTLVAPVGASIGAK